jgi:CHAT domain-containing protein/tetratricopeptide (TPR) repeat protein
VILATWQVVSAAPAQDDRTWTKLDAQAGELYAQGELQKAIQVAQAAFETATSPAESGRSLDRLGFLYYTSGDLAKGEQYLRQSLQTRESAFGPDSLEVAETDNDLAMLLRDVRRMDEARARAEHAAAVRERVLGTHTLPFAESLNTLATVYGMAGDYVAAVSQFERAVNIHEERSSRDRESEEYGTLCINLAGTYQRLGKYDSAESAFRKGLDALRVKPGINHPAFAASELAYASLETDLGHYVEAEQLYDEGGRLVERELGDQHPVYATLLNNRGLFYQSIGNVAAAEADYRRSLELKRKLYGPNSALAASTLRNLAQATYTIDRRRGEQLFAEAVAAYGRLPNAPPFDFASVLIGLARAQRDRGAVAEARATVERALDVSRAGVGERHPLYAAAVRELGLTLAAAGDSDLAEQRLHEALAIAEQVHGPQHPDVAAFLDALGDFYVARRDFAGAQPLFARSLDIQDRFWSDVLAIGSESFKAETMAAASDPIPRLIALQTAAPELPAARVLAFEAVTRRKGRIVEQVRKWHQRVDASASDAVQGRMREWQALLGCRTSLTVALGYRDLKPGVAGSCTLAGTDLEGRYERLLSDLRLRWTADVGARAVNAIATLQDRADRLEASLNREAGASPGGFARTTADDLRRELGEHEALVEFVSYSAASPGGGRTTRRYGAFVLTRSGPLGWVDVGSAAAIDMAVSDLLSAARDWSTSVAHHESDAARTSMQTAEEALADLSRLVWRPITPLVDTTTINQLRIAPDAQLNLVPFEALSDGRELIDRFTITYIPAGRDLVAASADRSSEPPVVVVSPGAKSPARRVSGDAGAAFRTDGLARLDAAAAEAADIRHLVPRALLFTGPDASERRVKDLHRPALLHVVGHGVVRTGDDCGGHACVAMPLKPSTQAMTLAAIVLEEAYGRGAGSAEDGLLTALELQNMDLRGTEMLVLSQCQMASGLASVGEGVYGMRRAAAIAGVNTFVAPLWNVEDQVQRRLMKQFYGELAAGRTRGEALRHAKQALRRSAATRSFLYWAPVIMSGSAEAVPDSIFHP